MTKKKTARPRRTPSTTSRARGKASRKAKAPGKKVKAAKRKAPGRKPTKQERRATHGTRRKPTAPDMTRYRRDGRKLTADQVVEAKGTIVRSLAMRGNVREATDAAGISRTLAYEWRTRDEPFREAWDDSVDEAVDRMEREMWRRGIEGFERPVIYQGEITDTYLDYSDSLLLTLVKGHRPEKYKERREHSTPPGQPLGIEVETKIDVVSSILGMIKNKPDPG